jgi:hypothetical protein
MAVIEEDYWSIELATRGIDRLSRDTKAKLLADRAVFWTWWAMRGGHDGPTDDKDEPVLFEQNCRPMERMGAYSSLGWDIKSAAFLTAWERGLSGSAATACLRDYGATPRHACTMDGAQFKAEFGKSWFDILPRINA